MRYVTRRPAKSYVINHDYGSSFMPYIMVEEDSPTPTGIIDQYGNEICRVKDPIGFRLHD